MSRRLVSVNSSTNNSSEAGSSSGGSASRRACSRIASMGGGCRAASRRARSVCWRLAIVTPTSPFDASRAYAWRYSARAADSSPAASSARAAARWARDALRIARSSAMRYSGRSGASRTAMR